MGLQFLFCTLALKFPLRRTGKTCTLIAPFPFPFVQITPRVVYAPAVWIRNIETFLFFRTRTSDPSLPFLPLMIGFGDMEFVRILILGFFKSSYHTFRFPIIFRFSLGPDTTLATRIGRDNKKQTTAEDMQRKVVCFCLCMHHVPRLNMFVCFASAMNVGGEKTIETKKV